MNAMIFTSLASAQAEQAAVDAVLGMPIAGVDIGGGVHAPASQSVTLTYFIPFKHPTLASWAYVSDAVTFAIFGPTQRAAVVPLDASWFPVASGVGSGVASLGM